MDSKKIVKKLKKNMLSVGSYKEEYDEAILSVAELYESFLKISKEKKDAPIFVNTEQGLKEHPIHSLFAKTYKTLLEGLRELGLTPKGNKTLVGAKPLVEEKMNLGELLNGSS